MRTILIQIIAQFKYTMQVIFLQRLKRQPAILNLNGFPSGGLNADIPPPRGIRCLEISVCPLRHFQPHKLGRTKRAGSDD
jgi:hypothetical protein